MSLSKKSRTTLTAIFVGIIIVLFAVTKIMYAPHEKTVDVESVYTGKASDFISNIGTDSTIVAGIINEIFG